MNGFEPKSLFATQMERIKLVTGKRTQAELARFFGIRQSSVSEAKRRGKIPSGWLVILMLVKSVYPEWILTGEGPCFMPKPPETGEYETGDDHALHRADEDALRRLPSRLLADELIRRIAVAQTEIFCSEHREGVP